MDKGTNRYDFMNNKIDKYEWIGLGSSYTLSEINASFLFQQLINMDDIIDRRKEIWKLYEKELKFIEENGIGKLCKETTMCKGNYHIFYIVFNSEIILEKLKKYLFEKNIETSNHYVPLHTSKYYKEHYGEISLINSEKYGEKLLRLPNFYGIRDADTRKMIEIIKQKLDYKIYQISHSLIDTKKIDEIIKLKSTFWKNTYKEQEEWIKKNILEKDVHFLIKIDQKLIGYGLVMKRNCNIVDSIIIQEEFRGLGIGKNLIKRINNFIKKEGFLLSEKKNVKFYQKLNWEVDNTLMIFNKDVKKDLIKMKYDLFLNQIYY